MGHERGSVSGPYCSSNLYQQRSTQSEERIGNSARSGSVKAHQNIGKLAQTPENSHRLCRARYLRARAHLARSAARRGARALPSADRQLIRRGKREKAVRWTRAAIPVSSAGVIGEFVACTSLAPPRDRDRDGGALYFGGPARWRAYSAWMRSRSRRQRSSSAAFSLARSAASACALRSRSAAWALNSSSARAP
jgi:hypothetical protein